MNLRDYIRTTCLLLGYTLPAGAVANLLTACRQEAKLTWTPVFLDTNQANTVAEVAETICPKTATPGAKELGVPQFIDRMLKELLTKKEQSDFTDGLADLDEKCRQAYDQPFVGCSQSQREAILTRLDTESPPFPPSLWGIVLVEKPAPVTFFRRLKSLTLMGYFTSEKIGKDVLVYDPIPGTYLSCIPWQGQNSWTE